MMILFAGCKPKAEIAETPTPKTPISIAIVPKAIDNPIFLDTRTGGTIRANALGVPLIWMGSTSDDIDEQIKVMETLIERNVDGILISCNDAEALNEVIDKAVDAGIVVATFDSDSPDSKRAFHVGSDNYSIGKKCADFANEKIGKGKLAVMSGVKGAANLEKRLAGLLENLNSDFQVMPIQYCDDDIGRSIDIVNRYTVANPDLAGWVFIGGWPLISEPEQLPELAKFTRAGGVCISVDTMHPMLQFVKQGIVEVLVGQNYEKMGSDGVQLLYDLITIGRMPNDDFYDTGFVIVDKNNVDEMIEAFISNNYGGR